ncbi:hypothetical protein trd_0590 [Thermomicrobium roseum DSM 5159]|uniref:Uncharacterized protein n=1 Tax=Thermomicrobium roseum (strain ATCC 27502 / DSM 5159 / P-2) TaxID=309801 RepID=B9KYP1_THERP|nr:hypothetical protein trd_0590 [Thermomicrobium roseum DSM 5159]
MINLLASTALTRAQPMNARIVGLDLPRIPSRERGRKALA